ncbi:helix-turn-helix transcriptional regulator [Caulobacter segnis]|uniref:helix-turn-helix domain-containing protein n=1 Tax=Caulobacter segnis TaxID=88688 RepID=UPI00240EBB7B|nr:helix-turn-helix transcriptional regulator [Caulobacter segnis]MDG2520533.1 helix-turn-helix transcriptional regulator [Caulobacter segnis]
MDAEALIESAHNRRSNLAQIIRTLRLAANLSVTETARRMGVTRRVYQTFEKGDSAVDIGLVYRFGEAVGADPAGIIVSLLIGDARFAYRVAENKVMLMAILAIEEWNRKFGDDLELANPNEFYSILSVALGKMIENARSRETVGEMVLQQRFPRLSFSLFNRFRKESRER